MGKNLEKVLKQKHVIFLSLSLSPEGDAVDLRSRDVLNPVNRSKVKKNNTNKNTFNLI